MKRLMANIWEYEFVNLPSSKASSERGKAVVKRLEQEPFTQLLVVEFHLNYDAVVDYLKSPGVDGFLSDLLSQVVSFHPNLLPLPPDGFQSLACLQYFEITHVTKFYPNPHNPWSNPIGYDCKVLRKSDNVELLVSLPFNIWEDSAPKCKGILNDAIAHEWTANDHKDERLPWNKYAPKEISIPEVTLPTRPITCEFFSVVRAVDRCALG